MVTEADDIWECHEPTRARIELPPGGHDMADRRITARPGDEEQRRLAYFHMLTISIYSKGVSNHDHHSPIPCPTISKSVTKMPRATGLGGQNPRR